MFGTILAFVIGVLSNWLFAHVYYRRAASELKVEAAQLRNLMRIMLLCMEEQGWAKLNRDASGNIIGFKFERWGSEQLKFGDLPRVAIVRGPMTGKE